MDTETRFYMVEGEPVRLTRQRSARLVVPASDSHHYHVAARLARSSRLAIDTTVPQHYLVVRGDPSKLEDIRHDQNIQCTRSAFLDADGHELFLTNEILVRFADTLDHAARHNLCRNLNCDIVDTSRPIWRIRTTDPHEDAPLDTANKLAEERGVDFAEPNALQAAAYASTLRLGDLFANQWHLHNTGQAGGKAGADVRALEAWKITMGSPDVRIVVHDNGFDINHPALIANMASGKDFDDFGSGSNPAFKPHGTACAGIISAVGNDGVMGIAPGCRLVPLRAASAHTWDVWAQTFDWAAAHGDIMSCSWSLSRNHVLTAAIRRAASQGRSGKGMPIFCAAGNGGHSRLRYPASLAETIAVGASTNEDVRAPYSQYGEGIDFVAPSSGGTLRIETTDLRGKGGYKPQPDGNYCKATDGSGFGGTSAAAPLAAGVAALMLSVNPYLTIEQVRAIMRSMCDKIDPAKANYNNRGWSDQYGYGRINAAAAVQRARGLRTHSS
ncbi:MAG: hypothetical protein ETSY1_41855 [Candidatus Entotheonella factor]|uniref:Peptidase S8/S53 domain-containing protein n=1 Tax=Entotheonella factor TaxID=1429438 RepID=W4L4P8_ENTF1|nr:MAG: hypothetical protein ETSY1_41855 [Candidatus Entotheonella factor]